MTVRWLFPLNTCAYTNMIYSVTGKKQLSLRVKYEIVKYWSGLITCQTKKLLSYL